MDMVGALLKRHLGKYINFLKKTKNYFRTYLYMCTCTSKCIWLFFLKTVSLILFCCNEGENWSSYFLPTRALTNFLLLDLVKSVSLVAQLCSNQNQNHQRWLRSKHFNPTHHNAKSVLLLIKVFSQLEEGKMQCNATLESQLHLWSVIMKSHANNIIQESNKNQIPLFSLFDLQFYVN